MGGQYHAPAAWPPGKRPGTHCVGGWGGPGPVWTGAENLASTGIRSPDLPARSESLYRLSYPGNSKKFAALEILVDLSDSEEFNMAWEVIQENIKISTKSVVGVYEWKKQKAWSDKQSSRFLDHAKQTKVQWLQDPSQTK